MSRAKIFALANSAVDDAIARVKNNTGAQTEKKRAFALYTSWDSE